MIERPVHKIVFIKKHYYKIGSDVFIQWYSNWHNSEQRDRIWKCIQKGIFQFLWLFICQVFDRFSLCHWTIRLEKSVCICFEQLFQLNGMGEIAFKNFEYILKMKWKHHQNGINANLMELRKTFTHSACISIWMLATPHANMEGKFWIHVWIW